MEIAAFINGVPFGPDGKAIRAPEIEAKIAKAKADGWVCCPRCGGTELAGSLPDGGFVCRPCGIDFIPIPKEEVQ